MGILDDILKTLDRSAVWRRLQLPLKKIHDAINSCRTLTTDIASWCSNIEATIKAELEKHGTSQETLLAPLVRTYRES